MVTDMLSEYAKKGIYESKEVKAFKKISPDVFSYFDGSIKLLDELSFLDIETFLYTNLLNVDKDLFSKKVNELAEEYGIVDTAIDDDTLKIYPEFLLKYVYINMKKFEKENIKLGGNDDKQ